MLVTGKEMESLGEGSLTKELDLGPRIVGGAKEGTKWARVEEPEGNESE